MRARFFRNFLRHPRQVASIVPSSRRLVERVARRIDFRRARRIVELGAGEGVHSRELRDRMRADAHLLLFEVNGDLAQQLAREFGDDPRIEVIHADAVDLLEELRERDWDHCDYVVSGIPFSLLPRDAKAQLIGGLHTVLAPEPHAALVTYQVTNELRGHLPMFHREISEYCLPNVPPLFINSFHKLPGESPVNGSR